MKISFAWHSPKMKHSYYEGVFDSSERPMDTPFREVLPWG